MENKKITIRSKDKSISEGYLAGSAALLIAVLWTAFDAFHPLIILPLYLIAIFCFFLSTRWLIEAGKTKKDGL